MKVFCRCAQHLQSVDFKQRILFWLSGWALSNQLKGLKRKSKVSLRKKFSLKTAALVLATEFPACPLPYGFWTCQSPQLHKSIPWNKSHIYIMYFIYILHVHIYTHINVYKYVYSTSSLQNWLISYTLHSFDLINILSLFFSLILKKIKSLKGIFCTLWFHFSMCMHTQIMKSAFYSFSSTVTKKNHQWWPLRFPNIPLGGH